MSSENDVDDRAKHDAKPHHRDQEKQVPHHRLALADVSNGQAGAKGAATALTQDRSLQIVRRCADVCGPVLGPKTTPKSVHYFFCAKAAPISRLMALLDRHHDLPLFIRTLPEAIAGATGQQTYERQDSDNTHDLIS
jgi:hypothetical protein